MDTKFQELLRAARRRAGLTQDGLATLIGDYLGTVGSPVGATIATWEATDSKKHSRPGVQDRPTLRALIASLVKADRLLGIAGANELLLAGGYAPLSADEEGKLFPASNRDKRVVLLDESPPSVHQQFYVERSSDRIALASIRQPGETISINGPHGFGKSLLLHRLRVEAARVGKQSIRFDFQFMDRKDAAIFFQAFCAGIADQLGLDDHLDQFWNRALDYPLACTRYLERYVFKAIDTPLLLAMDETDRLIHSPFRDKFFGMLRGWHNNRASEPSWRRLDLVLAISMDPSELVKDEHQSPFNIGKRIELTEFTRAEIGELNKLVDTALSAAEIEGLIDLVGGHPTLINQALLWLQMPDHSLEQLLVRATDASPDNNPFATHLQRQKDLLLRDPALVKAMRQVLRSQRCPKESYTQLNQAGLVRSEGQVVLPRCQLYAAYFEDRLR